MYFMYIDESGDTAPISQGGTRFLVLTGCIVRDIDRVRIELDLRSIKRQYFQDEDVEIKSNFLRYANPDVSIGSPLKLHDRDQYNQLENALANYLKNLPVEIISVVIDKPEYWKKYPSQNPYEIAYLYLLERFQMFLKSENAIGICMIDPREGQVEKTFIGDSSARIHHMMRWKDGGHTMPWKKCENIVERLLYTTSESTIGIQVADLYCYPIFHVLRFNKSRDEYWRFKDITFPKFHRVNKKIDGYGLKFFPNTTKKDLKLFEIPF